MNSVDPKTRTADGQNESGLSGDEHIRLQTAIIEQFVPRFGHGAKVLCLRKIADELLVFEEAMLRALKFPELANGQLPDMVAYSAGKNWLYLIEAPPNSSPISAPRRLELQNLTADCTAGVIFVTAFLDRGSASKFIADIAWQTEVWIADEPEHIIHFDGCRLLGPYDWLQASIGLAKGKLTTDQRMKETRGDD